MKSLLLLNDLHIGVKRSAGTTPASAQALRQYLLSGLMRTINEHPDKDVVIVGDLFDAFEVDLSDLWGMFSILADWLVHRNKLTLIRGNHDYSPKADKVSSFDILANVLRYTHEYQVHIIRDGLEEVSPGIWAVPHMPNQDLFDMELDKAMKVNGHYLLTHCNMMPPDCYGRHDHSLAIEEPRARELAGKFVILNAHEHQRISYDVGRGIYCLGNQFPSSIADCLSNGKRQEDGLKYATVIHADMGRDDICTWGAIGSYQRIDWRELDQVSGAEFIRVSGDATAAESTQVMDAIAKLRNKSSAFVIANAVRIDGQEGAEQAAEEIFQGLKGFNVMGALLNELNEKERKVVEEVLS